MGLFRIQARPGEAYGLLPCALLINVVEEECTFPPHWKNGWKPVKAVVLRGRIVSPIPPEWPRDRKILFHATGEGFDAWFLYHDGQIGNSGPWTIPGSVGDCRAYPTTRLARLRRRLRRLLTHFTG